MRRPFIVIFAMGVVMLVLGILLAKVPLGSTVEGTGVILIAVGAIFTIIGGVGTALRW